MDYSFIPRESNSKKPVFYETEILRKAYELILENSDLFFEELTKAFATQEENRESDLIS
jgi:hypothetical protein